MAEKCLVCLPVDLGGLVVAGSVKGHCSKCSAEVWVAPSGQAMLCREAMDIICLTCFRGVEVHEIADLTPEQVDEMTKTFGYPPYLRTGEDILRAYGLWRLKHFK